ncbi:MAG: VPLPA-CTERM sorting domain-containing protein, partial [Gammaproteobacteria bacterium]|nr:VPLPA-CTERM sorting domain-containing protein [Gammaproteobacteria bacterium]
LEYLAGPGPLGGDPCDNSTVVCGSINMFYEGPSGFDETVAWVEINPVPVPAALPLMVFALGALGVMRRRT